jgi:transposase
MKSGQLLNDYLLPKKKLTCPPTWSKRQILDGIFYQLKNGCNWADLPSDGFIEDIMEIIH